MSSCRLFLILPVLYKVSVILYHNLQQIVFSIFLLCRERLVQKISSISLCFFENPSMRLYLLYSFPYFVSFTIQYFISSSLSPCVTRQGRAEIKILPQLSKPGQKRLLRYRLFLNHWLLFQKDNGQALISSSLCITFPNFPFFLPASPAGWVVWLSCRNRFQKCFHTPKYSVNTSFSTTDEPLCSGNCPTIQISTNPHLSTGTDMEPLYPCPFRQTVFFQGSILFSITPYLHRVFTPFISCPR